MTQSPSQGGQFYARDRSWHPPALTPGYKSTALRAPRHALLSLPQTASELTGPTFGHGAIQPLDNDLIRNFSRDGGEAIGQRLIVYGQVLDENARPVSGTLVELWQANAGGRYRHKRDGYQAALDPNFGGCGRVITDERGYFHFRTIRPGAYPWPNGGNDWRPAHIHFSVFGHAFAQRLITQMYFEGDPMIWQDPIALAIPDHAAIEQLIAKLDRHNTTPMDALAYRFDIVLRGRRSTLFENRREGN
jgi:protocatechuate 3,4-dioxygenase beta subunit